jgi:U3 small nucleolar RNA-associated protein 4
VKKTANDEGVGDEDPDDEEEEAPVGLRTTENGVTQHEERETENPKWFMTFKYRPILGIVPVTAKEGQPVQVGLIERPVWDLKLPPRFESVHSRGR